MDRLLFHARNVVTWYNQTRNRIRRRIRPPRPRPIAEIVRAVPLFQMGHDDFFNDLVESLEQVNVRRGFVIINEGDIGNEMYFIRKGSVGVTVNGVQVVKLEAGGFFGEIALVRENSRRNVSIAARGRCELYRLSRENFRNVLREYGELERLIIDGVVTREDDIVRDGEVSSESDDEEFLTDGEHDHDILEVRED